jgi:1,4-dihydroxy-2-naphthoate octaprenyltransferase
VMRALGYLLATIILVPIAFTIGYLIDSHQCDVQANSCSGIPFIEGFFWAVGAVVLMVVVVFANEIRLTKEPRD